MALYEWLDRIEARPGMYLTPPGFGTLKAFIDGYETALTSGQFDERDEPFIFRFSEFVVTSFGCPKERVIKTAGNAEINLGATHWSTAIIDATTDDQEAFKLFFRLLHQFRRGEPPTQPS